MTEKKPKSKEEIKKENPWDETGPEWNAAKDKLKSVFPMGNVPNHIQEMFSSLREQEKKC